MCWEDKKRSRVIESFSRSVTANGSVTLPANPMRVAVIVSMRLTGDGDIAISPDDKRTAIIAGCGFGRKDTVLRIEDYGQGVTQALFIDGSQCANPFGVTESILNEAFNP